ncbi:putative transcription factor bHLH family [Medicago truncatula]|uniref:Putative transcription factor bHLH family n=1 Tax=Medicago truncatula TaxID=3880 RepID=A0A396ITL1_MEDTR|nr:putative transcription factor bHLH family [Medicago truncatula]
MDKVSILGDAVDYLKELKQQINDLQSEIKSSSHKSFMPLPMTSTMSTLPVQLKEQLFQNNVSSLKNQPAKVFIYFKTKFLFLKRIKQFKRRVKMKEKTTQKYLFTLYIGIK